MLTIKWVIMGKKLIMIYACSAICAAAAVDDDEMAWMWKKASRTGEQDSRRVREIDRECVNQHEMISGVLTHLFVYFLSFRHRNSVQSVAVKWVCLSWRMKMPACVIISGILRVYFVSSSLSAIIIIAEWVLKCWSIARWRQANIYHQIDQHALNYVDLTSIKRFAMYSLQYICSKRYKYIEAMLHMHAYTHTRNLTHTWRYLIC